MIQKLNLNFGKNGTSREVRTHKKERLTFRDSNIAENQWVLLEVPFESITNYATL